METITLRLHEETINELEAEADDRGVSRSEHIRDTLQTRHEHERTHKEYEERIAGLERQVERLENEKRLILEQREENTELAEYIDEERTWREAGLGTRMKWWLFGKGGG